VKDVLFLVNSRRLELFFKIKLNFLKLKDKYEKMAKILPTD